MGYIGVGGDRSMGEWNLGNQYFQNWGEMILCVVCQYPKYTHQQRFHIGLKGFMSLTTLLVVSW